MLIFRMKKLSRTGMSGLMLLFSITMLSAQTSLRAGLNLFFIEGEDKVETPNVGVQLGFESVLGKHGAVAGTLMLAGGNEYRGSLPGYNKLDTRVVSFQPELRYYLKSAMQGIYLGAHLNATITQWRYRDINADELFLFGPGLSMGATFKVADNIDIHSYMGFSLYPNIEGGRIDAGLNLGYRF
jgi:hypothetical protein